VFCSEKETITHLFFECTVAKCVWEMIREIMSVDIGDDYLSVAAKWLCRKITIYVVNVASAAVLRGLSLTRNDFVFKKQE
jgi:hypothetical protein